VADCPLLENQQRAAEHGDVLHEHGHHGIMHGPEIV
jgi:hypothetical protein